MEHITPMHRNYDNAGPDIPGLKKDFSPDADTVADMAVADMIAFDQLGPLDGVRWQAPIGCHTTNFLELVTEEGQGSCSP